jgi:hypothetical protein
MPKTHDPALREAANHVAQYWARHLGRSTSNYASPTSAVAAALSFAEKSRRQPLDDQRQKFTEHLTTALVADLQRWRAARSAHNYVVDVDYIPPRILLDAMHAAGIPGDLGRFPFKTMTIVTYSAFDATYRVRTPDGESAFTTPPKPPRPATVRKRRGKGADGPAKS